VHTQHGTTDKEPDETELGTQPDRLRGTQPVGGLSSFRILRALLRCEQRLPRLRPAVPRGAVSSCQTPAHPARDQIQTEHGGVQVGDKVRFRVGVVREYRLSRTTMVSLRPPHSLPRRRNERTYVRKLLDTHNNTTTPRRSIPKRFRATGPVGTVPQPVSEYSSPEKRRRWNAHRGSNFANGGCRGDLRNVRGYHCCCRR